VTRPSATDSWPVGSNRLQLAEAALSTRAEPITRDWIVQRYRRAGALAVDQAREDSLRKTRPTSRWDLSKSRLTSPAPASSLNRSIPRAASSISSSLVARQPHPEHDAVRAERAGIAHLSTLHEKDPMRARSALQHGESVAHATSVGVQVAVSTCFATIGSPSNCCWWWGSGVHSWNTSQQAICASSWWWWGSSSFWWPCWGPSWGCGFWFHHCGFWGWGSPCFAQPFVYYYAPAPVYYTYVIEEYAAPDLEPTPSDPSASDEPTSYPSRAEAAERNGNAQSDPAPTAAPEVVRNDAGAAPGSMPRAASEYLTLGDRAFQDARYSDAVYAYGRAAEIDPTNALVQLILSDALFATGDYHYCAFALRKALEIDPSLIDSVVDKHSFYGDPTEFDRQLALLERYVQDHFVDDDARLVLAANYLFANRPAQSADLLESAFSLAVRESPAGQIVLKRARAVRETHPSKF
jgi:hypothetical protein